MMALSSADALSRYLLNRPITGAYELTEKYLMVAAIFLGLSYAYRGGVFIRVTFLVDRLPSPLKLLANYGSLLISLLFCVITIIATMHQALRGLAAALAFGALPISFARDLYTAASNWCSHIKGGLAIATVFACGIFGAMSGASTAAASVMSKIAMPEMRRHGYSDELAAGAIGIGATLDILIPPSIALVIYGIATQTSIGKL